MGGGCERSIYFSAPLGAEADAPLGERRALGRPRVHADEGPRRVRRAAQGPAAQALLKGHEETVGPCGADTPFERHARSGGQVLLIGVDLDTLTLLHTAEALLDLPYLNQIEGRYLGTDGLIRTSTMRQAPGGHRGGVRGFEKVLKNRGLIRYGRIGRARTMLLDAGPALDAMVEILTADPAAALCRGECCPDCVDFKGKIRAQQLASLGAEIAVVLPQMPDDPEMFAEISEMFLDTSENI